MKLNNGSHGDCKRSLWLFCCNSAFVFYLLAVVLYTAKKAIEKETKMGYNED